MGRVGIEPTTLGLKVPCSAAELPARMKLTQGINPSQSKGSVGLGSAELGDGCGSVNIRECHLQARTGLRRPCWQSLNSTIVTVGDSGPIR
jgi:hypothetical protein